jgi:hypothetical protein
MPDNVPESIQYPPGAEYRLASNLSEQESRRKKPTRKLYIGDSDSDSEPAPSIPVHDVGNGSTNPLKEAMADQKRRVVSTLHSGASGRVAKAIQSSQRPSRASSPAALDHKADDRDGQELFLAETELLQKRRQIVSDVYAVDTTRRVSSQQ